MKMLYISFVAMARRTDEYLLEKTSLMFNVSDWNSEAKSF
jgi:hypothetical protein